ncbi:MAG: type II secretion system protein GspG [Planctomycetes bacterium]|nr:type II secretion system protein GspG [Planctomycetota bacterium]MBI3846235.1 type II secretion system protein GspG [Planctomycetota bacterium]
MTRKQIVHATRVSIVITGLSLLFTWLIPTLAGERTDTRTDRALEGCRRIAAALSQYQSDTGLRPDGPLGDGSLAWLHGAGTMPSPNAIDRGPGDSLDTFLVAGGVARCGDTWAGPYIRPVAADPWGRAFVVNVRAYAHGDERPWVLSAGPDGVIETRANDVEPRGDDLGVPVK